MVLVGWYVGGVMPAWADVPDIVLHFYDTATIQDSCIRLGDVARIDGEAQTRAACRQAVIGQAAPPGYSRRVNAQRTVHYTLSHHFPGITFQCRGARAVTVATASREYRIGDFAPQIRARCDSVLAWEHMQVAIRDSQRTFRVLDKPYTVSVCGIDNPHARGTLRGSLRMQQEGYRHTVAFCLTVAVRSPVVVATGRIARGARIYPSEVSLREMDITHFNKTYYTSLDTVRHFRATRTIGPGEILSDACIEPVPVVEKGQLVRLVSTAGAVRISVEARAREDGAKGECIWVQNSASHTMIKAIVKGAGKVIPASEQGARL